MQFNYVTDISKSLAVAFGARYFVSESRVIDLFIFICRDNRISHGASSSLRFAFRGDLFSLSLSGLCTAEASLQRRTFGFIRNIPPRQQTKQCQQSWRTFNED